MLRLRDPDDHRPRLRPAEHLARGRALPRGGAPRSARCSTRSRAAGGRPGIVYVATQHGAERDRRGAARARRAGDRLPRRHEPQAARRGAGARSWTRRRRRRDGRDDRLRHGRRQARRALGLPPRRQRVGRRLLPGARPRRARRRAGRGRALLPARGPRTAALLRRRARSTARRWSAWRDVVAAAGRPVDPARCARSSACRRSKLADRRCTAWRTPASSTSTDDGGSARSRRRPRRGGRSDAAEDEESTASAFDRSRVEMMRAYAEHHGCRRAFLLGYFGEALRPAVRQLRQLRRGPRRPRRRADDDGPSRSATASTTTTGATARSGRIEGGTSPSSSTASATRRCQRNRRASWPTL